MVLVILSYPLGVGMWGAKYVVWIYHSCTYIFIYQTATAKLVIL